MKTYLKSAASGTALLACLIFAGFSEAQDANPENPPGTIEFRNGISVYRNDYFEPFSPVTALDMVSRVPGFSVSNGNTGRRGLGDSFGNVLINGARPSNKSLSLGTVLQRIPISDVDHIELISEALPEYNMRGYARLVNVILVEGAGNSGSWDAQLSLSESGRLGPQANISWARVVGPVDITFGLFATSSGNLARRRRTMFDAADTLTEIQHDNDQQAYREATPSFSLNWQIDDRSNLRFDIEGTLWRWANQQVSFIDAPAGTGVTPLRYEQNATDNHGNSYFASATYAVEFSDTLSSQTMGLLRRSTSDNGPEINEAYDPASGFLGAIIVNSGGDSGETALRQTLIWTPNDRNTVEFGGEIAVNTSDNNLALFQDDGTTVTPIVLPVASTRVEETRSEIFVNDTWTISDQFSLESGLRYEFSEIVQTGDAEQSRSFAYPKPSVTLNWRRDEHNRVRFTAQRDVAQLDFGKFASSVDIADNNATIGNPDYVPQRTWTLETEWERRFGDDASFSLQLGYDWIEDLDGWIPVTTADGVYDAPGNIGDGTNLRLSANLTTPMDRVGLSNAVLDASAAWYNTNVTDPLTGADRPFSGYRDWEFGLVYRQTFPAQQLAWGWESHWASDSEVFRAQEYRRQGYTDGDLSLYIETTRWGGVTTRLGVDGLTNNGDDRKRVFYTGSRADGIIAGTEYRNENYGATWYLRARGTF
ncbi:TonB-dependent receptor [uncultured Maricaulis sp.]|uniref:TonB-dependent receptor plug domain-containing protein n=1 Tax=uncultured Maricaulis sp. TaxID=174710 RepID=UPI0030D75B36|tara:strand:- start:17180 stop:19297 length:2118 start_codon:yes stop_codon:yes gene_type:complete